MSRWTRASCGWAVIFFSAAFVVYAFNRDLAWFLLAISALNVAIGYVVKGLD